MKSINEERLFRLIDNFFADPSSVLTEIAQNASRSGATWLHITTNENELITADDGYGTSNPEALFVLADSDWNEIVETNQTPAGWGLYMLISISNRVTFQSRFGTITVDCERFLKEKQYRENILEDIDSKRTYESFFIHAALKPEVANRISKDHEKLGFFPLNITLNGISVKRLFVEKKYTHFPIKTEYEGNPVYINMDRFLYTREDIRRRILTIWYGIPVEGDWRDYHSVVIDVKQGSPLTPTLPYRKELKKDDQYEKFANFVRETAVNYCKNYINDMNNTDSYKLIEAMDVISNMGTQNDLDMLVRFYVSKSEPHSNSDSFGDDTHEDVIVSKGESYVSEELSGIYTIVNGKKNPLKVSLEDICLPLGSVTEYSSNKNKPSWLNIKKKNVTIEITMGKSKPFSDNYRWFRVKSIRCGKKSIDVLAAGFGDYDGEIYYRKNPDYFYNTLTDIVFGQHIYYDDGDTYDTQKNEFEEKIIEDISQIKKEFNIHDLLKGLALAGINALNVVSLSVKNRKMSVTIKKKNKTMKKVLNLSAW